jgi:hypothetical protein
MSAERLALVKRYCVGFPNLNWASRGEVLARIAADLRLTSEYADKQYARMYPQLAVYRRSIGDLRV